MGTRFTGRGGTTRTGSESVTQLEAFCTRLRRLGADDDEVLALRNSWDDREGWLMPRATLVALPDSQLRALLESTRDEYRQNTTDEADDQEAAAVAALAKWTTAVGEYEQLTHAGPLKITDVREWVGTDLDRASVAREAELVASEPRKTLVAFLEALLVGD